MTKSVMIAEDHMDTRLAMKLTFEEAGFAVVAEPDGESFKSSFARSDPDAVVLDVRLPDTTGQKLCAFVRQTSTCPILMFTGYREMESITSAVEAGATGYVLKLSGVKELVERVEVLLAVETMTKNASNASKPDDSSGYANCGMGCRALVAATDAQFREELVTNVQVRGWTVDCVETYEEFQRLVYAAPLHAIVLDESFEDYPIGTLAKDLKTDSQAEQMRIVGLSGQRSHEKSRRLMAWVDVHIKKPCSAASVADALTHDHSDADE